MHPGATTDPETPAIRLAHPADREMVEAIVAAAYAPYVARIGRPPGPMLDDYAARIDARQVHVMTTGNTIVALLVLIAEPHALLLDNIAVAPAAQGHGFGRQLLRFAEQQAIAAGYQTIRLYTNAAMTRNIELYTRIGYVETHRSEEHGLHRVFMQKPLA